MGITLASNFDVNAALPLDSRMVVADLTARDAIAAGRRFQGMCVYVLADTLTYQLKTGVLNTDWVEYGGGIAAATFVEKFSGDGGNLVFTLANDPLAIENTMVFVDGVYQQKTTSYILNMTDVEFVEAPPIGVDNIEVMYTTPTGTLVIPDGYITTVHLADDAVTTDKILDASVTDAKIDSMDAAKLTGTLPAATRSTRALGTGLFEISKGTPVAYYSNSTNTYTSMMGSAALTTSGGPVSISVNQDFTSLAGRVIASSTGVASIIFKRGTTVIGAIGVGGTSTVEIPASSLSMIDYPPAGTYTYSIEARNASASNISLSSGAGGTGFHLVAYEL